MRAEVGDEIVVRGRHVGDEDRRGVITEVHGEVGGPPYLVRWENGHESMFMPSSDSVVEHRPARGTVRLPVRPVTRRHVRAPPGRRRGLLRRYPRPWLRGDLLAGVTVAAYLVPQVMGRTHRWRACARLRGCGRRCPRWSSTRPSARPGRCRWGRRRPPR